MDIIVEGTKSKSYKPNEVNINLTFTYVDNKYDACLEEGLKLIEGFVFNTLSKLNIDKDCFKTRNFQVRHKTKFDYQNNKDILNTADSISHLSNDEIDTLATGMVVSRMFRNNIEKMMNTIFGAAYLAKNPTAAGLSTWNSIKFVQSDYVGNTKVQAKQKFISSYKTVCAEYNK